MALGAALRRIQFLPPEGWAALDRVNYWVFLPALIFKSLATNDRGLDGAGPIALTLVTSLLIVGGLTLLMKPLAARDGPTYTSVVQGSIRFNSFVALLVVPTLYPGTAGLTALLVALTVPLVNVMSVTALAQYASSTPLNARVLTRSILSNPLIIASLGGILVARLGVPLGPVETSLDLLGRAALAAGLLSVGATLRFGSLRHDMRSIVGATLLKFAVLPAVVLTTSTLFGVPQAALPALLLFHAMPTASSSFLLARAMHGNERTMAAILASQTVLALLWLPLVYAATPGVLTWWGRVTAGG
jgi:predicted permease